MSTAHSLSESRARARVCEMMSMMGGGLGDRCECAECPEFLRVVGRRTVTMFDFNSNGRYCEIYIHRTKAISQESGNSRSGGRALLCCPGASLLSSHSAPSSHTAAELSRSADACHVGSWQQVWHRRGRRRRVHN